VPGWMPTLFAKEVPQELVDEVVAIMSDFHPAGYRAMILAFADLDLRDVLPQIEVPTLLLYGAVDRRSPLHVAEAMPAQIAGSTLAVIPGVGYMSSVEAPDRFNAEVRTFLRAHPR